MKPTLDLAQCGDTLSTDEVCQVLGIGRRTWDGWDPRDRPLAPLESPSRRLRYAKVDVERYLVNPRKGTPWQRRLQVAS